MLENFISIRDRGLLYGDGIFRTMRIQYGQVGLLALHLDKLQYDCSRLNIACPNIAELKRNISHLANQNPDAVLKLIVTRGITQRGYAANPDVIPSCFWDMSPLPNYPAHWLTQGLRIMYCDTRLALQPKLAGIKHLNRLENVLAANELSIDFDEGLLLDYDGYLVEGTRTNVFWYQSGRLYTPDLSLCGVAGVGRAWIFSWAQAQGIEIVLGRFFPQQLADAEELFLVNSVMGICPVQSLGNYSWSAGDFSRKLQTAWQDLFTR